MAPAEGGLSEPGVERFDEIGGVDDPPDFGRECQERCEVLPRVVPQADNDGVAVAPIFAELFESLPGGGFGGSGVDRLEGLGDGPQCCLDAYRRLARTRWTTHSWTAALGQISLIDSGRPFSPSQQTIMTSSMPRLRNSARVAIQCLAPSPPSPTHIPNTSRSPARLIPTATYTARFDTWPSLIS